MQLQSFQQLIWQICVSKAHTEILYPNVSNGVSWKIGCANLNIQLIIRAICIRYGCLKIRK